VPLIAIALGVIMIDLAMRGTEHEFAKQLESDFGQSQFWSWVAAIWVLGAIGAVPELRRVSTAGMALVIVALVLANGGLFEQLAKVITAPPKPAPAIPLSAYPSSAPAAAPAKSSGSGGGLFGKLFGGLGNLLGGGGGGAGVADAAGVVDTGVFTV
jgi:hypothetical protein